MWVAVFPGSILLLAHPHSTHLSCHGYIFLLALLLTSIVAHIVGMRHSAHSYNKMYIVVGMMHDVHM